MRVVQFQVDMEDYSIIILMEDGRMFCSHGGLNAPRWTPISLPEHPMGMPVNPMGPPPEDRR